jgi:hypothetical protein
MATPSMGRNDYKLIQESGAKYVRIKIYPEPEGVLEEAFEQARAHGLKVIPYIGEGQPRVGENEIIRVAKEMDEQFGPGTSSNTVIWEVGNEPNIEFRGDSKKRHEMIVEFTKYYEHVVNELRSVRKSTQFLLPGLFGFSPGGGHITAREFVGQMTTLLESPKKPIERPFVGVSIHPYTFRVRDPKHLSLGAHPPGRVDSTKHLSAEEAQQVRIEDAQQLTKAVLGEVIGIHDVADGKPVWVTELGFPLESNEKASFPPVGSEFEQALLVKQSFGKLLEKRHKYDIKHAFYFNIQDIGTPIWYHRCGLFDSSKRPHEAWDAFKGVVEEEE